jgi:isopropylmalate/homocitrate/citramalate synthase
MPRDHQIYDTTLRDGTQGEGISFSVADKLLIAERLDQFGVDYIEGGFPGSNPRDIAFFAEAKSLRLRHAKLAAFGSTRRAGTKADERPAAADAPRERDAGPHPRRQDLAPPRDRDPAHDAEENLAMIEDSSAT